jgi:hypothetical protein
VETVTLPPRKRKAQTVVSDKLLDALVAQLAKVKVGQAISYEPDKYYATEGKARSRARLVALALSERRGISQPKTHVIPHATTPDQWTPAISPNTREKKVS